VKIFISYRRAETQQEAQRIRLQLQLEFGIDSVFIDRNIPLGQEFDKYLETELKSCNALIAVMGDDFFRTRKTRDSQSQEEIDYVRWEIETALQMEIPVFPIIVQKLEMPREKDLPDRLKAFTKKQALYAMDPAFETAIDQLIKALKASGLATAQTQTSVIARQSSSKFPESVASDALKSATPRLLHLWAAFLTLTIMGWFIATYADRGEPTLASLPGYFLLGLVFSTTTVSITFSPLWFYKLVNVIRARLYLNVGSLKSVVVTCSAVSLWVTNSVFLSLATNRNFEYTFLGITLPIWSYIGMGLLGTLWLAFLAAWEVSLNSKQHRGVALILIFGSHALNCLIQVSLLYLILRSVAAGDPKTFNGLMLYLTACLCGTATFSVTLAWRDFFASNGYWSIRFLSGTLVAAWVFLTMASYSHGFATLIF
jgi:hypothetical protein